MPTQHEFVVTFAKVERHGVEGTFPRYSNDRENDYVFIEVQCRFRYPVLFSRAPLYFLIDLQMRVSLSILVTAVVRSDQKKAVNARDFIVGSLQEFDRRKV